MLGYQLLVIETENGFVADKVDPFFSTGIHLLKDKPKVLSREAKQLYNSFGKTPNEEFELSTDELNSIRNAKTNNEIHKGKPIYHDLACDGISIIPLSKDRFLSWEGFKDYKSKRS